MMLERFEIEPVWSDSEFLYVRDPEIPDGALVATTRMAYAPNISRVEILPDPPEEGEETTVEAGGTDNSSGGGS